MDEVQGWHVLETTAQGRNLKGIVSGWFSITVAVCDSIPIDFSSKNFQASHHYWLDSLNTTLRLNTLNMCMCASFFLIYRSLDCL